VRVLALALAVAQPAGPTAVGTLVIRDLRAPATVTPDSLEHDLGQKLVPEVGVRCEGDTCPVVFLKTADGSCVVAFSRTPGGELELTRGGFDVIAAESDEPAVVGEILGEAGFSPADVTAGMAIFRKRRILSAITPLGDRSLVLEITTLRPTVKAVRFQFSVDPVKLGSYVVP
jgi:hypothetical protein